jgi:HSP20 family protein
MPWDVRAWHARLERLSHPNLDGWEPAIDVYETADAFVITAEVPGLTRDQIDLALEESRLTIQGHRMDDRVTGGAARNILLFHQIERGFGSFSRRFDFADKIDVERVTADLADGVLTITLPKAAPPPARRIAVT